MCARILAIVLKRLTYLLENFRGKVGGPGWRGGEKVVVVLRAKREGGGSLGLRPSRTKIKTRGW